jgi:ABC-type multidrug transport system ATPase subunit
MNSTIVSVKNLSKSFKGFQAVKNVSFTVNKNDVFGFLGPNGAGKSTSLRCMLSLIKEDSGDISLFGMPMKSNRTAVLSNIGSIIEKPDFYKYLSAYKNLELLARISGSSVSKSAINDILEFVGLQGRENHRFRTFSHGMKQRLGIAQALMHNPELIILDEPTTGLDPQGIVDIRNLILKLSQEQGKTVILSSHQLSEIEMIANRMVIINKGETLIEGSVNELLNTSQMVVRFQLDDVQRGLKLLSLDFGIDAKPDATEQELELEIEKMRIPDVAECFMKNGIRIYSIEQKRKLEDYFIKMIKEG